MATMVVGALRGRASGRASRSLAQSLRRFASTLVVAEHEGGFLKPSSLSALAAAEAIDKENKISLLLGGSGPTLRKASEHAASSHPLVSEVLVADSDAFVHPLAEPWAELLRSVQHDVHISADVDGVACGFAIYDAYVFAYMNHFSCIGTESLYHHT